MKKIQYSLVAIVMLICLQVHAQQEPISTFPKKWEYSKKYLLAVAETVPEDQSLLWPNYYIFKSKTDQPYASRGLIIEYLKFQYL